eukprot:scaffold1972_cov103-Isochrysis_galbana.AAC.2
MCCGGRSKGRPEGGVVCVRVWGGEGENVRAVHGEGREEKRSAPFTGGRHTRAKPHGLPARSPHPVPRGFRWRPRRRLPHVGYAAMPCGCDGTTSHSHPVAPHLRVPDEWVEDEGHAQVHGCQVDPRARRQRMVRRLVRRGREEHPLSPRQHQRRRHVSVRPTGQARAGEAEGEPDAQPVLGGSLLQLERRVARGIHGTPTARVPRRRLPKRLRRPGGDTAPHVATEQPVLEDGRLHHLGHAPDVREHERLRQGRQVCLSQLGQLRQHRARALPPKQMDRVKDGGDIKARDPFQAVGATWVAGRPFRSIVPSPSYLEHQRPRGNARRGRLSLGTRLS